MEDVCKRNLRAMLFVGLVRALKFSICGIFGIWEKFADSSPVSLSLFLSRT